jgi:hypothetical protein
MSLVIGPGITIGTGISITSEAGQIVSSGLQLYLDAADGTSYPGSGTIWSDLSGNGNDVTMQNSGSITYSSGGGGYFATGSTGWFSRASGTNLPTGNTFYTLSVWVQLAASWSANGFISIGSFGSGNQSNAFRTTGTNGYSNYWWANDLGATSTLSPTTQWFNAVAKFDGTTRSIWINGVLAGSDTPSGHNVTTSALQVAKTFSGEYLNGNIGQALVYNRALSTAEIQQNYEATRTRYGV